MRSVVSKDFELAPHLIILEKHTRGGEGAQWLPCQKLGLHIGSPGIAKGVELQVVAGDGVHYRKETRALATEYVPCFSLMRDCIEVKISADDEQRDSPLTLARKGSLAGIESMPAGEEDLGGGGGGRETPLASGRPTPAGDEDLGGGRETPLASGWPTPAGVRRVGALKASAATPVRTSPKAAHARGASTPEAGAAGLAVSWLSRAARGVTPLTPRPTAPSRSRRGFSSISAERTSVMHRRGSFTRSRTFASDSYSLKPAYDLQLEKRYNWTLFYLPSYRSGWYRLAHSWLIASLLSVPVACTVLSTPLAWRGFAPVYAWSFIVLRRFYSVYTAEMENKYRQYQLNPLSEYKPGRVPAYQIIWQQFIFLSVPLVFSLLSWQVAGTLDIAVPWKILLLGQQFIVNSLIAFSEYDLWEKAQGILKYPAHLTIPMLGEQGKFFNVISAYQEYLHPFRFLLRIPRSLFGANELAITFQPALLMALSFLAWRQFAYVLRVGSVFSAIGADWLLGHHALFLPLILAFCSTSQMEMSLFFDQKKIREANFYFTPPFDPDNKMNVFYHKCLELWQEGFKFLGLNAWLTAYPLAWLKVKLTGQYSTVRNDRLIAILQNFVLAAVVSLGCSEMIAANSMLPQHHIVHYYLSLSVGLAYALTTLIANAYIRTSKQFFGYLWRWADLYKPYDTQRGLFALAPIDYEQVIAVDAQHSLANSENALLRYYVRFLNAGSIVYKYFREQRELRRLNAEKNKCKDIIGHALRHVTDQLHKALSLILANVLMYSTGLKLTSCLLITMPVYLVMVGLGVMLARLYATEQPNRTLSFKVQGYSCDDVMKLAKKHKRQFIAMVPVILLNTALLLTELAKKWPLGSVYRLLGRSIYNEPHPELQLILGALLLSFSTGILASSFYSYVKQGRAVLHRSRYLSGGLSLTEPMGKDEEQAVAGRYGGI